MSAPSTSERNALRYFYPGSTARNGNLVFLAPGVRSLTGAEAGELLSLDGVSSASVSLMGKSAKVEYDERRIDVLRIIEKVAAAGYAAEPTEDDAALSGATDDGETRRWRRLFLVGSSACDFRGHALRPTGRSRAPGDQLGR